MSKHVAKLCSGVSETSTTDLAELQAQSDVLRMEVSYIVEERKRLHEC
ncbi:MAG: hypothetical protein JSV09_00825 [Thermoplasmata archaeon]|nr:MAG: hypothetical protein JSV09_00825 [Thermoplasmata archaeon]